MQSRGYAKQRMCSLSCASLLLVCAADAEQEAHLHGQHLYALCFALMYGEQPIHIALR